MANPLGDHTISWHDGESDGIPIFSLLNGLRMRDRGCEFVMMLRGRVLAVAERPSAMSMSEIK
jgi:hypothetical protein